MRIEADRTFDLYKPPFCAKIHHQTTDITLIVSTVTDAHIEKIPSIRKDKPYQKSHLRVRIKTLVFPRIFIAFLIYFSF